MVRPLEASQAGGRGTPRTDRLCTADWKLEDSSEKFNRKGYLLKAKASLWSTPVSQSVSQFACHT